VTAWSQLVSVALLGTARREPPPDAPLAIERDTREAALLARAGALAVYRAAGARGRSVTRDAAPSAEPEALPRCSPRAAGMLAAILEGDHPGVLWEWLDLAGRRGVRVPEELLPALLTVAGGEDRELARPVLGERGRWLAGLREDWAWAAAGDEVWETGAPDARAAWLSAERERDPAAAREALEEARIDVADERDAVIVDLHDKPGAMGEIARDLAEAGVSVDVAYTIFSGVRLVIVTDDTEKARAALDLNGAAG
jgi:hypothetical protein